MWVEIAKKQNTITMIQTVKEHLAKDAPQAIEDGQSKTVTAKTFKVHDDQKATIDAAISKAKDQGSTQSDTVALEYICSDFLGSQTIHQKLKSRGIEAALGAPEKAFPNAKIEVEEEVSKVALTLPIRVSARSGDRTSHRPPIPAPLREGHGEGRLDLPCNTFFQHNRPRFGSTVQA